ncbi:hypothetical protein [Okeania sp. SIO2C9]|nr:hypothetical protein [Okeania sp. SIO2C9]
MGRWGDRDLPLTSSRRGIWGDSYISFAQLNVFQIIRTYAN